LILIHFVGASFNVNGNEFAIVRSGEVGTHIPLVDFVAAAGEFFLGVAALQGCHKVIPWNSGWHYSM